MAVTSAGRAVACALGWNLQDQPVRCHHRVIAIEV